MVGVFYRVSHFSLCDAPLHDKIGVKGGINMVKTSKAQLMALAKFKQEKRDTLTIDLPKGSKDGYKKSAAGFGISLTKLIQAGIEEYIQNHGGEVPTVTQQSEQKLSPEQRRLVEEFNRLPPDVQKSIIKMIQAINAELESNKIRTGK